MATNRKKIKQCWCFLVTLPNGTKYIDTSINKTPQQKCYWYYKQIQKGTHTKFYDEIRKVCNNRTDDLEIKILDFYESNVDELVLDWCFKKSDEWCERYETYNEEKGGLNGK